MLVSESIAYSRLAGLPPQAGLYTLLATLAAYAIFGTSRHRVAGFLRLGFIAQSDRGRRWRGSCSGLAIFVTVSQLPKLFGIEKGSDDTIKQLIHPIGHLGTRAGDAVSSIFSLSSHEVKIVGRVPSGLPTPAVPSLHGAAALRERHAHSRPHQDARRQQRPATLANRLGGDRRCHTIEDAINAVARGDTALV